MVTTPDAGPAVTQTPADARPSGRRAGNTVPGADPHALMARRMDEAHKAGEARACGAIPAPWPDTWRIVYVSPSGHMHLGPPTVMRLPAGASALTLL